MTDNYDDIRQEQSMLAESSDKVFSELCDKELVNSAETGLWPTALWQTLDELGFLNAAVPEAQGGSGMSLAAVLPTARIAARYSAPIPYGETLIAAWLLGQCEIEVPSTALTFGPADRRSQLTLNKQGDSWALNGELRNIPWGSSVDSIVITCPSSDGLMAVCAPSNQASIKESTNLAGEPRSRIHFDNINLSNDCVKPVPSNIVSATLYLLGALLRSLQIAGGLITARDLAVQYTSERIAFGKPLNRLQAVQQNLAVIAGQTAAANVAADMALDAIAQRSETAATTIAMSKIRANEAVEVAARLAHQAHGAIGFTHEHPLHQATRRLWSWRDEFGNDAYWSEIVGQQIIDAGSEQLWPTITQVGQM